MKTFLNSVFIFIIVGFLFINGFVLVFPFMQSYHVTGEDIHDIIELSKHRSSSSILIIGDSVARQLLRNLDRPNCLNLTCNQAISMVGQYILVHNIFSSCNNIKTILLIYHPRSFRNNLDQRFTFNYFCKPFFCSGNSILFSKSVSEILHNKPSWLACIPMVRYSSLLGELDYSNGIEIPRDSLYISSLSAEYIEKIDELASRNNAEFVILSPVVSEYYNNSLDMFEDDVVRLNLDSYFIDYKNSMLIGNYEMFFDDIHLNSDALAEVRNVFIDTIRSFINNI